GPGWTRPACAVDDDVLWPFLAARHGGKRGRAIVFGDDADASVVEEKTAILTARDHRRRHGACVGDDRRNPAAGSSLEQVPHQGRLAGARSTSDDRERYSRMLIERSFVAHPSAVARRGGGSPCGHVCPSGRGFLLAKEPMLINTNVPQTRGHGAR